MASSSPAVPAVAVFSAVAMAFAAAAPVPAWAVEPDSSRDPAAAPGFSDVTGGPHMPGIEALDELGLFEGTLCGGERFCPQDEMPRWVMAVWLARALPGDDPVPAASSRFADVDPREWWAPHVERLAEMEITVGCNRTPLRFCPGRGVSRGQMASFLVRAFDLEPVEPWGFADIEDSVHSDNINALATAGITVGCKRTPLRFCPAEPVSRAQMATFLARALGLVDAPAGIEAPADPPEFGQQAGEGAIPPYTRPFPVSQEAPLRVYVAGDSQAHYLGRGLRANQHGGVLDVTADARHSTSLARPDYFDWPARLTAIAADGDPEVVVMMLGSNDWQNMTAAEGGILVRGSDEWIAEWARRLRSVLEALEAPHRHVVWVGLPPTRSSQTRQGYALINRIATEVTAERDSVAMIDIWDMFGGDDPYREAVPPPDDADGTPVTVRHPDGIHLNEAGALWVVAAVSDEIERAVARFEQPAARFQ